MSSLNLLLEYISTKGRGLTKSTLQKYKKNLRQTRFNKRLHKWNNRLYPTKSVIL